MGVPPRMLPHQVTRVRPAETENAYGSTERDYGPPAARKTMAGWLQQDQRTEPREDGRDPLEQRWLLITNDDDVLGRDRIEWTDGDLVLEVEGPPAPVHTPAGYHHTESTLRVVNG